MRMRRLKEGVKPIKKRSADAIKRAVRTIVTKGRSLFLWRLPMPIAQRVKERDCRRNTTPKSCGERANRSEK